MKTLLRTFVFVSISLFVTQYLINAFDYGSQHTRTFLLIAVALATLYYLVKPVLKITAMPSEGLAYLFLLFALTFALLYVLTMFISDFSLKAAVISNLLIFGFVIPSTSLTALEGGVVSSALISIVYAFLQSLCSKK